MQARVLGPKRTVSIQSLGLTFSNSPYSLKTTSNISKLPQTPKKHKKRTDAPDTYDPYADDDPSTTDNDAGSTDSPKSPYSLKNAINISKCPQHPKNHLKNITDAPDGDAEIAADNDVSDARNTADCGTGSTYSKLSPYSLRNLNHYPDADDYDAASPNDSASPNDAASPNSLIDSKIKCKIDPRSIIKQKH